MEMTRQHFFVSHNVNLISCLPDRQIGKLRQFDEDFHGFKNDLKCDSVRQWLNPVPSRQKLAASYRFIRSAISDTASGFKWN
jgi:hypothetical protein